jgi:hypothetical protein
MVRRVERAVGLAYCREQAVERSDDGDRECGDHEVVAELHRQCDAVGTEQREQGIGKGQLAEEWNARAHVGVDRERDDRRHRRAGGEADELRRRRRPPPPHQHEYDDRDDSHEHRPPVDAVMRVPGAGLAAAPAMRAEHLGNLVPDERDRETGHQSRDDG